MASVAAQSSSSLPPQAHCSFKVRLFKCALSCPRSCRARGHRVFVGTVELISICASLSVLYRFVAIQAPSRLHISIISPASTNAAVKQKQMQRHTTPFVSSNKKKKTLLIWQSESGALVSANSVAIALPINGATACNRVN